LDKQIEIALRVKELESDKATAQSEGKYLQAAYIGLARSEYAKVAATLSDEVEARNEDAAALAVNDLQLASLENAKEMIDAADGSEEAAPEASSAGAGEKLKQQVEDAIEAADDLTGFQV